MGGKLCPKGGSCIERPKMPCLLIGGKGQQLGFEAMQNVARAQIVGVEPDGGIDKGLHASVGYVLFASSMLGYHLQGQRKTPSVCTRRKEMKALAHSRHENLLVVAAVEDEALPVDPGIELIAR